MKTVFSVDDNTKCIAIYSNNRRKSSLQQCTPKANTLECLFIIKMLNKILGSSASIAEMKKEKTSGCEEMYGKIHQMLNWSAATINQLMERLNRLSAGLNGMTVFFSVRFFCSLFVDLLYGSIDCPTSVFVCVSNTEPNVGSSMHILLFKLQLNLLILDFHSVASFVTFMLAQITYVHHSHTTDGLQTYQHSKY